MCVSQESALSSHSVFLEQALLMKLGGHIEFPMRVPRICIVYDL